MIVHLTREAEADLEVIGDHIAQHDPARAVAFIRVLRDKCLSLAELPHGFPIVERYAAHGLRRRVHGNYLIFYQVEAERIVVIHVLHGARDYEPLLLLS